MDKKKFISQVTQLENWILKFHRDLPHLPKEWSRWIATYAYVFVILGIIFWVIGGLSALVSLISFFASPLWLLFISLWWGFGGFFLFGGLIASIVFFVLVVVLLSKGYNPVKLMQKKWWDSLFYINIINIIYTIINIIFFPSSIISGIISVIIWLYILFEIREYFQNDTQDTKVIKKS